MKSAIDSASNRRTRVFRRTAVRPRVELPAAQVNEKDLERLFQMTNDAMCIASFRGFFSFFNPPFAAMMGSSVERLLETPFEKFVHPDDLEATRRAMKTLVRGEPVSRFVHRIRCDNGLWKSLSWNAVPVIAEKKILAIARDVTRELQRSTDLSEHEDELRLILESSPIPLGLLELTSPSEGRIVFVNRKMTELFGYSLIDIPTVEEWWKRVYPDDAYRSAVLREWTRRLTDLGGRNGEVEPMEVTVTTMDGSRRDVECRMSHVGRRQVVTFMDMTDKKRAADEMRLKNSALEASTNAIVITDPSGVILWANAAFGNLTGYLLEEVIGRNPRILKSNHHGRDFYEKMWTKLLAGKPWSGELTNRRKDGSLYQEDMTITPCKNAEGDITHFIAIKQDVTEKRQLQAQYLRAQRMESIGTLAGGIAHDLNNVLAPILMSIDLLKTDEQRSEIRSVLNCIEKSARHGAELVKQVLSFARGASGDHTLINLLHIARDVRSIIADTFPKNIEFRLEFARDLWLVDADATQMHQVLMNLCVNARDAMPDGGTLTLALRNVVIDEVYAGMNINASPGNHLAMTLQDSGAGIPDSLLERIFEPFFTTKEIGEGTGLGLSTTLGIVRGHAGFINVYSEMGKGTKFSIYLPASPAGQTAGPAVADSAQLPMGRGEQVLLVDDDEGVRAVVKRTLEKHGYRVLLASHGAEAVALYAVNGKSIAVVITDMAMPVMDGASTIVALRSMNPNLPIIASSGRETNQGNASLGASGTIQFISKPYTAAEMLKVLSGSLGHRPDARMQHPNPNPPHE